MPNNLCYMIGVNKSYNKSYTRKNLPTFLFVIFVLNSFTTFPLPGHLQYPKLKWTL